MTGGAKRRIALVFLNSFDDDSWERKTNRQTNCCSLPVIDGGLKGFTPGEPFLYSRSFAALPLLVVPLLLDSVLRHGQRIRSVSRSARHGVQHELARGVQCVGCDKATAGRKPTALRSASGGRSRLRAPTHGLLPYDHRDGRRPTAVGRFVMRAASIFKSNALALRLPGKVRESASALAPLPNPPRKGEGINRDFVREVIHGNTQAVLTLVLDRRAN